MLAQRLSVWRDIFAGRAFICDGSSSDRPSARQLDLVCTDSGDSSRCGDDPGSGLRSRRTIEFPGSCLCHRRSNRQRGPRRHSRHCGGIANFVARKCALRGRDNPGLFLLAFVLCLTALAACSLAVIKYATSGAYFALAFGVVAFVLAIIIRRFQLDIWGYLAIVATIVVVVVAAVAVWPGDRVPDLTLAFATSPQSPMVGLTRRILNETGWLGSGAGTFAAILPIYRDINELAAGNFAPTAAAAIAIEMGKPFFWAAITSAVALIVVLLRGAASRGKTHCTRQREQVAS